MKYGVVILIFFVLSVPNLFGQVSYSGSIAGQPIELATNIYSDGDARAVYAYKNYNDPIITNGKIKNKTLVLYEKDGMKQSLRP